MATMEIRKSIQERPIAGIIVASVLVIFASLILLRQFWPEKQANLSQTFFTDDDGKTWYTDSAYLLPPLDHNGTTAVFAEVFSYDGGSKQFCAYLAKYTPEAQRKLRESIGDAVKQGHSPASAGLFHDPFFMKNALMVKKPGSDKWVNQSDPAANEITSIQTPDGSAPDQVLVY